MQKLRYVLAGMLMLGLAIPGAALADNDDDSDRGGRRCSNIGTWFEVESSDDTTLKGGIWTAMGKSQNHGTNILEQPTFDPKTFSPNAVSTTTMRGNWDRTGNRTFVYTLMGYAVNASHEIEYINKVKGDIEMTRDCQFARISVIIEVFLPPYMDPFEDEPAFTVYDFGSILGRRAHVELP